MTECETCGDTGQKYYRDSGALLPCDDCKPTELKNADDGLCTYCRGRDCRACSATPTEPSVDVERLIEGTDGN